ncbi:MAG: flavodoxin domain-containing protein [Verrucomicrobiota bacterium]
MITIAFATETGNAQDLAEETQNRLYGRGFESRVIDIEDLKFEDLREIESFIAIVSTWGDGEPPMAASDFYEAFRGADPMELEQTSFAVLALGDTAYELFCQFGKDIDSELERHGAKRMMQRLDCDLDFEDHFDGWVDDLLKALESRGATAAIA